MKTVIQFTGMTSDKYGSFEKYHEELAKQLNDKGFKSLLVYNKIPTSQEHIANLRQFGTEVLTLSIDWGFFKKFIAVLKILLKYKPTIIHCHFSYPFIRIVIPLAWLFCVPKRFITIHSMLGSKPKFISRYWIKMLNIFSTKFLTVSDAIRNQLKNSYYISKKVETLRLGIDFNKFDINPNVNVEDLKQKYGLPTDKFVVGNIAFHQPIKGIDVLLQAMAVLKYDLGQNNMILCQVGGFPGDYIDKLHNLSKELKIENEIIWLGCQDNVPEVLRMFDVYCQPSRSEGLGLALVEALATKLPVVATKVGGIPEIIEDNVSGLLVEREDFYQMAEKILILKNDKHLCEKYATQGYKKVIREYDKVKQVEKLMKEYI